MGIDSTHPGTEACCDGLSNQDRIGAPSGETAPPAHGWLASYLIAAVLSAGILGLVFAWAVYKTGSPGAAYAYLRGNSVYVSESNLTVSGQGSESRPVTFSNLSDKTIRILGYNALCSCVRVSGLPLDLGPQQSGSVTIRAESSETRDVPVVFMTDEAQQATVRIDVKVIAAKQ